MEGGCSVTPPHHGGDEFQERCRRCWVPWVHMHPRPWQCGPWPPTAPLHHRFPLTSLPPPQQPFPMALCLDKLQSELCVHLGLVCHLLRQPKCSHCPAMRTCPGKPSPFTQSVASLLGSSATDTIHRGLASTSPVVQHLTLPRIFSSVTLFFGCQFGTEDVCFSKHEREEIKKKPLWLKIKFSSIKQVGVPTWCRGSSKAAGTEQSQQSPSMAFAAQLPAGSAQLISSQTPKLNGLNQLWDTCMPVTWARRSR